jgi:hypothetical protein
MAAVVVAEARTVVAEAVTAAVVEARAAVAVEAAPTAEVVAEARTVVGEAVPGAVVVARTEAVHTDTKFQIYKARPKVGAGFFLCCRISERVSAHNSSAAQVFCRVRKARRFLIGQGGKA